MKTIRMARGDSIGPAKRQKKAVRDRYGIFPRTALKSASSSSHSGGAMTDPNNPASPPDGNHRFVLRVYYEDTDFSARVYHASYLRFLERGRTEWLRTHGFEQRELAADATMVFAVRRIEIDYLRAALMDDLLTIETRIVAVGGASIDFAQAVFRGDEKLARATVSVAALSNGRPMRLPSEMRARFSAPR
jgi:acyl-CoA thioester hydrolase